jgi:hypothetical protein
MLSNIGPDIENEMDEIQRASQDLSRDENIDISVEEIIKSFENSKEVILSDDIWEKLENTESNEIEKGDFQIVFDIAKKYNKTNPRKLAKSLKSGDYKRPLILNFEDRYILVAGNTRLSTSAAMGMNPKVFIARVNVMKEQVNNIKGGLSDNKTIEQIAKKHSKKENFEEMLSVLKKQLSMGMKVEMEHTKDKTKAKEIAMDHLYEDPKYYSKLKKVETKEATDSGSSGSYSAPLFSTIKKPITKIHNSKSYNINEDEEFTEATLSSSSGQYDVPFGGGTKGRKNPLKIDGEKSIKNSRAVKDKNFPKWGGPDSVFIKVKEKCKKFPYCNQGIDAIELLEMDELNESIKETSNKYGISEKEMKTLVLNEIKKIFM